MAKIINISKETEYHHKARKLKAAKLINFDLRKKLTPAQKGIITKLFKDPVKRSAAEFFYTKKTRKTEYQNLVIAKKTGTKKEIFKAEKAFFRGHKYGIQGVVIRTVKDKKKLKEFKAHGYLVTGNRVYINADIGSVPHVKTHVSPLTGNKVTVIETIFKNKRIVKYIENSLTILDELENMKNHPLPVGQHVMVSIGGNNPIAKEHTNYRDLMKYISEWKPKDENSDKAELINEMSIVYMNRRLYGG